MPDALVYLGHILGRSKRRLSCRGQSDMVPHRTKDRHHNHTTTRAPWCCSLLQIGWPQPQARASPWHCRVFGERVRQRLVNPQARRGREEMRVVHRASTPKKSGRGKIYVYYGMWDHQYWLVNWVATSQKTTLPSSEGGNLTGVNSLRV